MMQMPRACSMKQTFERCLEDAIMIIFKTQCDHFEMFVGGTVLTLMSNRKVT